MVFPIELIIYIDQYIFNYNILYLNKQINKEIKQSNNSDFWKSKYLKKTKELHISKIALDTNHSKINSKYEYIRLIKQSKIIKNLSIYNSNRCIINLLSEEGIETTFDFTNKFIDHFLEIFNYKKINVPWSIKFTFPECSFDIKKFKIPKEFHKLKYIKFNKPNHRIWNCKECRKRKLRISVNK